MRGSIYQIYFSPEGYIRIWNNPTYSHVISYECEVIIERDKFRMSVKSKIGDSIHEGDTRSIILVKSPNIKTPMGTMEPFQALVKHSDFLAYATYWHDRSGKGGTAIWGKIKGSIADQEDLNERFVKVFGYLPLDGGFIFNGQLEVQLGVYSQGAFGSHLVIKKDMFIFAGMNNGSPYGTITFDQTNYLHGDVYFPKQSLNQFIQAKYVDDEILAHNRWSEMAEKPFETIEELDFIVQGAAENAVLEINTETWRVKNLQAGANIAVTPTSGNWLIDNTYDDSGLAASIVVSFAVQSKATQTTYQLLNKQGNVISSIDSYINGTYIKIGGTGDSDAWSTMTVRQAVLSLKSDITALQNLGHYIGTFDTVADLTANGSNTSKYPHGAFVNDFVYITNDENHDGLLTLYVCSFIASDGAMTFNFLHVVEQDLTGKVDKTATPLKVYGTDENGNQYLYDMDAFNSQWGHITGTLSDQEDLQAELDLRVLNYVSNGDDINPTETEIYQQPGWFYINNGSYGYNPDDGSGSSSNAYIDVYAYGDGRYAGIGLGVWRSGDDGGGQKYLSITPVAIYMSAGYSDGEIVFDETGIYTEPTYLDFEEMTDSHFVQKAHLEASKMELNGVIMSDLNWETGLFRLWIRGDRGPDPNPLLLWPKTLYCYYGNAGNRPGTNIVGVYSEERDRTEYELDMSAIIANIDAITIWISRVAPHFYEREERVKARWEFRRDVVDVSNKVDRLGATSSTGTFCLIDNTTDTDLGPVGFINIKGGTKVRSQLIVAEDFVHLLGGSTTSYTAVTLDNANHRLILSLSGPELYFKGITQGEGRVGSFYASDVFGLEDNTSFVQKKHLDDGLALKVDITKATASTTSTITNVNGGSALIYLDTPGFLGAYAKVDATLRVQGDGIRMNYASASNQDGRAVYTNVSLLRDELQFTIDRSNDSVGLHRISFKYGGWFGGNTTFTLTDAVQFVQKAHLDLQNTTLQALINTKVGRNTTPLSVYGTDDAGAPLMYSINGLTVAVGVIKSTAPDSPLLIDSLAIGVPQISTITNVNYLMTTYYDVYPSIDAIGRGSYLIDRNVVVVVLEWDTTNNVCTYCKLCNSPYIGNKNSLVAGTNITLTHEDDKKKTTISASGGVQEWGDITGDITKQTDLSNALNDRVMIQMVSDGGVQQSTISNTPSVIKLLHNAADSNRETSVTVSDTQVFMGYYEAIAPRHASLVYCDVTGVHFSTDLESDHIIGNTLTYDLTSRLINNTRPTLTSDNQYVQRGHMTEALALKANVADYLVKSLSSTNNNTLTIDNVAGACSLTVELEWGNITGPMSAQGDLTAELNSLSTAITGRVEKTSLGNKVYGTDSSGAQIVYDMSNGFPPTDWGTIGGEITQQTDLNNELDAIKLSIANVSSLGLFLGTFATKASLPSTISAATVKDFAYVQADETHSNLLTCYIISAVAETTNIITWSYAFTLSTDISSKIDKLTGVTSGAIPKVVTDGGLNDSGLRVWDLSFGRNVYGKVWSSNTIDGMTVQPGDGEEKCVGLGIVRNQNTGCMSAAGSAWSIQAGEGGFRFWAGDANSNYNNYKWTFITSEGQILGRDYVAPTDDNHYVQKKYADTIGGKWGGITGAVSAQTDLKHLLVTAPTGYMFQQDIDASVDFNTSISTIQLVPKADGTPLQITSKYGTDIFVISNLEPASKNVFIEIGRYGLADGTFIYQFYAVQKTSNVQIITGNITFTIRHYADTLIKPGQQKNAMLKFRQENTAQTNIPDGLSDSVFNTNTGGAKNAGKRSFSKMSKVDNGYYAPFVQEREVDTETETRIDVKNLPNPYGNRTYTISNRIFEETFDIKEKIVLTSELDAGGVAIDPGNFGYINFTLPSFRVGHVMFQRVILLNSLTNPANPSRMRLSWGLQKLNATNENNNVVFVANNWTEEKISIGWKYEILYQAFSSTSNEI